MKKLHLTLLVISLLFFSECEKGYLDEPKPTESVNSSVILNPQTAQKPSCLVSSGQAVVNLKEQTPEVYTQCILPES